MLRVLASLALPRPALQPHCLAQDDDEKAHRQQTQHTATDTTTATLKADVKIQKTRMGVDRKRSKFHLEETKTE